MRKAPFSIEDTPACVQCQESETHQEHCGIVLKAFAVECFSFSYRSYKVQKILELVQSCAEQPGHPFQGNPFLGTLHQRWWGRFKARG